MTGQEYIQRQINLVKQQIKGSRVKFTITDAVTKFQYDLYENELQTLESIEKSLKALEIIKKKCLTNCNIALVKDNLHYQNYRKEFEYFLNKYNESPNGFEITKEDLLTKEEFELLKEVLK